MKLLLYNDHRLGVLKDGLVYDAMSAMRGMRFATPSDRMRALIARWEEFKPLVEEAVSRNKGVPVASVTVRPPIPHPTKIICAAVNYLEFGQRPPADLEAFIKSSEAVIGNGDTVVLPPCKATIFHHEAELGLVIGKDATDVAQRDAMKHVFGYLNFVDVSARGLAPGGRVSFFLGKSWDTFAPMGPVIVTADEVPDPQNLRVRMWCNGQPRHDFNTSDMAHKIPELIEFMSGVTTLRPGDVISTGTNHQGIGPVQDGNVVEMEIDGLERLVFNVRDPLKRSWPHSIDYAMAKSVLQR